MRELYFDLIFLCAAVAAAFSVSSSRKSFVLARAVNDLRHNWCSACVFCASPRSKCFNKLFSIYLFMCHNIILDSVDAFVYSMCRALAVRCCLEE